MAVSEDCQRLASRSPIPAHESERLKTLRAYGVLDTLPEQSYEDITKLAAFICETPISLISLVDSDRQWFKSERGLGAHQTPRSQSFCANTLVDAQTLIVTDARTDPRFKDNPLVLGDPNIRFYAGAPIVAPGGLVMGTVCVIDTEPRELSADQIEALEALARQVMVLFEHRTSIARVEEALGSSKEAQRHQGELAAIVSSSDDAILSKDLNGIITSWNVGASRIFGYSSQEMVGESILKLIPDELHSDETLIIGKVRNGERVEHFETERLTKDGRRIEVALTVSPVRDAFGNVIGASKVLRDISARKLIEKSLLQAEKIAAAGRMASTIAHEVNNPLEAVTNLLYLLRPLIVDTAGLAYLATAESEIARISNIAKQTLGFYHEHTAVSSVSVSDLVQHAVAVYEPRCTLNGIVIEKSLRSTQMLFLRQGETMQIVSNLIANSMYAMPSGGTLGVSTEDINGEDSGVLITIRDTGVGIAAQHIPKVFDAFFTTRSAIGTGIGLFVAKQFVEGHGGRIELQSNDDLQKHGTAVRIYLPLQTSYEGSPLLGSDAVPKQDQ
ncbi:sensor histidine kinase [Granulicella tundricola]|uniref:sensor histidine kinase n=1 Tax=Granulicella tundricola TaxID=940615 RepID=UPI001E5E764C|nr:sensor histidine kinase [Granulicella tundricola]